MHNEILFINIAKLVNVREGNELLRGADLAILPVIEDAFLLIEDGYITDFGAMFELKLRFRNFQKILLM